MTCIGALARPLGRQRLLKPQWNRSVGLIAFFASLWRATEQMVGSAGRQPAYGPDRLLGGALGGSTRLVGCCTRSPEHGPLRHCPPRSDRCCSASAAVGYAANTPPCRNLWHGTPDRRDRYGAQCTSAEPIPIFSMWPAMVSSALRDYVAVGSKTAVLSVPK